MDRSMEPLTPSRLNTLGERPTNEVYEYGKGKNVQHLFPITPMQRPLGKENAAPGTISPIAVRSRNVRAVEIADENACEEPVLKIKSVSSTESEEEKESSTEIGEKQEKETHLEPKTPVQTNTNNNHLDDIQCCAKNLRLRLELAMYKVQVNQTFSPLQDLPIVAKTKLHNCPNSEPVTSIWNQRSLSSGKPPSLHLSGNRRLSMGSPTKSIYDQNGLTTPRPIGSDDLTHMYDPYTSPLRTPSRTLSRSSSHYLWVRHGKLTRSVSLLQHKTPRRIRPKSLSKSNSTPLKHLSAQKPNSNYYTGPPTPVSISNTPENIHPSSSEVRRIASHSKQFSDYGLIR
ncbi:MBF complex corepressor Nrm1 [Schizosaccharomyces pombe]|uniref:Transcription factor nrm1 n=1 Tax=Schizosaccharomyces pombe (strain 972 / ATCC 24843) TaxID=284812 RepID=NRM1_SCHPO|nr:protein nrm1 [Schizosaccharomyces pombe]O42913.1 RecName: Full=Transcription factor nrm1; AltName: Full=Negative regulator of MBF targets 1 [Schizosaccharomyces pombe 972h-]CAA16858.1 negative regulator of MBF [Schizosaccharomyces pombe]|eukprot:NP_596782.1 protein nrm1 [Schizosaccharomyces pombe]